MMSYIIKILFGLFIIAVFTFGCNDSRKPRKKYNIANGNERKTESARSTTIENQRNLVQANAVDSIFLEVYGKSVSVQKKKGYGMYLKRQEHPGLIQIRSSDNDNKIISYILFDSMGNIQKERNIEIDNPYNQLKFDRMSLEKHKNLIPDGQFPSPFDNYYIIDRPMSEKEKSFFSPDKIIPNYTKDLKPKYYQVSQSVGGFRLQAINDYKVSYGIIVLNKDFIPIKLIGKFEIYNSKGELYKSIEVDDNGFNNGIYLSEDRTKLIMWAGGDICCEGAYLTLPHYRVYDLLTGVFLEKYNHFPYQYLKIDYEFPEYQY